VNSSPPTPAQIQQVQTNLQNMQALNDYVYNQGGSSRIMNAYLLLSESDNSDPGLVIGLNVLEGAFWAIGGSLGPIGNFAASFLSGMLAWWAQADTTPPSLNQTFASMLIRVQQTSLAVDAQLAQYYQDVPGNWNTSFTYNGQTTTLADLATIQFPAETDPTFEQLAAKAIFALDQQVWTTVLKANFVITLWEMSSGPTIFPGKESDPPISWDEAFIAKNPAYYNTWTWHSAHGCGDTSGWEINEYNVGTGAGVFSDGSMSHDACNYLFIDSYDGVVINANGLFPRATVFNNLGIRQTTYYVSSGSSPGPELSAGYMEAMAANRTLGELVARQGRESIQSAIIAKAHSDPVFARDVVARTRPTLEEFLGVKIPETISLTVIAENAGTFALVIPAPQGDSQAPA
jgi:hypothetical protein